MGERGRAEGGRSRWTTLCAPWGATSPSAPCSQISTGWGQGGEVRRREKMWERIRRTCWQTANCLRISPNPGSADTVTAKASTLGRVCKVDILGVDRVQGSRLLGSGVKVVKVQCTLDISAALASSWWLSLAISRWFLSTSCTPHTAAAHRTGQHAHHTTSHHEAVLSKQHVMQPTGRCLMCGEARRTHSMQRSPPGATPHRQDTPILVYQERKGLAPL